MDGLKFLDFLPDSGEVVHMDREHSLAVLEDPARLFREAIWWNAGCMPMPLSTTAWMRLWFNAYVPHVISAEYAEALVQERLGRQARMIASDCDITVYVGEEILLRAPYVAAGRDQLVYLDELLRKEELGHGGIRVRVIPLSVGMHMLIATSVIKVTSLVGSFYYLEQWHGGADITPDNVLLEEGLQQIRRISLSAEATHELIKSLLGSSH